MDNSSVFSEKRYKMICQIQEFLSEGCSYREIAKRMGVGRNTIAKYREGDPKKLSMYGIRQSKLDIFYDFIIQCLDSQWSKSKTIKEIYAKQDTNTFLLESFCILLLFIFACTADVKGLEKLVLIFIIRPSIPHASRAGTNIP